MLVTGGSGFIGRQVVGALLGAGHDVVATTRSGAVDVPRGAPGETDASLEWVRLDVLDADRRHEVLQSAEPDVVVNVAWHTDPATVKDGDANLAWVAATVGLVDAAAAAGAGRFVGVGSCFEYDDATSPMVESTTPLTAATRYGRAKTAAWHLSSLAAEQHGMSSAWARPFYVLGPHENPQRVLPYVVRRVLAGEVAETSHGRQVRDFSHVADVGAAIAAIATSAVSGPVNVGLGRGVSLARLFTLAAEAAGDVRLLALGARAPGPAEAAQIVADVTRLRQEVGFVPRFATIEDAVVDTVGWWRGRHPSA